MSGIGSPGVVAGGPAGKLGSAQVTANVTTTSTTFVDATGLSVTVTIPSDGRDVKITFFCPFPFHGGAAGQGITGAIYDVTAEAQLVSGSVFNDGAGSGSAPMVLVARHAPAAGSRTYKVQLRANAAGTAAFGADATNPAFLLVEGI